MSEIKLEIGKRIIQQRKKSGLTASELARKANISRARLNNWESGRRTLGLDEGKLLAEILHCSPAYLLCLSDFNPNQSNDKSGIQESVFKNIPIKTSESILTNIPTNLVFPLPQDLENKILENSFIFPIPDDSMESNFSQGDYVLIEPKNSPKNGDYILAHIKKINQVLFRKYAVNHTDLDNITIKLSAFNPEWTDIELGKLSEIHVLGIMPKNYRAFL